MAGYYLFNYLFNVKDRHNGNILIDSEGHLIHIDFGFMLQSSPGGMNFETSPFKLTKEYIDLLGGNKSEMYLYFKCLMIRGFYEVKRNLDDLLILIDIMAQGKDPHF